MTLIVIDCECDDMDCERKIKVPDSLYQEWSDRGLVVISDACADDVSPGSIQMAAGQGFVVYQPPSE